MIINPVVLEVGVNSEAKDDLELHDGYFKLMEEVKLNIEKKIQLRLSTKFSVQVSASYFPLRAPNPRLQFNS